MPEVDIMQKKKEDRIEAKNPVDSGQIKKVRAEKQLDEYVKTDAHKKAIDKNDNQQKKLDKIAQSMLTGGMDTYTPEVIQDEAEQRLLAEIRMGEAEHDAFVAKNDQADIEALSAEEQDVLEQYAVNQIRDQNLPVEMVGVMPTARQEAAPLIDKIGQQRVDELAETYMRQQNAELAQQVDQQSREFADKHGVIGSALTVPVAALNGVVGTVGQLQGWARNTGRYSTLDPNATGTIGDVFTGAVRGQVAQNIEGENPTLLSKGLSIGYQGLMSAADSIARAYLGGGAFGGATLAATGSFSQTMADAARQGATPAQAALLATATSGIEALTEAMPLDDLIRTAKGGNPTGFIVNVLRQMGIEAATEEVSLLGSLIAEAAIMREKSGFNQTVNSLILLGKTEVEARQIAAEEIFNEALNTALVSAVSGIGSGVSAATANEMNLFAETGAPAAVGQPKQKDVVKSKADLFKKYGRDPLTGEKMAQETVDGFAADMNENAPEVTAEVTTEAPQEVPAEVAPAAPVVDEGQQIVDAVTAEPSTAPLVDGIQDMTPAPEPLTEGQMDVMAAMDGALGNQPTQQPVIEPATPQEETAYQDEFEDWGKDPNREGVENPLSDRSYSEVGKRSVKAYMYENPAVKPFYQEQAAWLLSELADSTKGERTYNEQMHYESGGEQGWSGTKRHTSESIAELLDQDGMSYDQIERGLNAIVNDHGQENNAVSKRIEFVINDRLMNGYTDFYTGEKVPGNAEYLNLLRNQQSAPDVDTSEAVQMDASNIQQQSTEDVQGIKGTGAAEGNFSGNPAYNATLSEDNSQADRRDDVRPMELPRQDVNSGNVSAVTGNVYGSRITPDEFASLMEEPTARGDFSYAKITNDQATQRATETIASAGTWENAYDSWKQSVSSGNAGAEMSARGALLLNHAAQQGDKQLWLETLHYMQKLGTNTAQGLQAFRIIRTLQPADKIEFVRMSVEKMAAEVKEKHGIDLELDQTLIEEFENADTDEARDAILEDIQQDVASQIPSTFLDKWTALRYMNMLGNLKTNVRNIAGNIGSAAVYRVKDTIATGMESIAHAVSGGKTERTKSLFVRKSLLDACKEDFNQFKETVSSGGKYGERMSASSQFEQGVQDKRRIFKNPGLEAYRKGTNWMMNNGIFGDEAFGRAAYSRALAGYLQANGVTGSDLSEVDGTLLDRARAYAIKEAQEATFHDNSTLAQIVSKVQKDTGIVGQGLMPFTKTPANVLTRAEEFSPLGLINSTVKSIQKARGNEDISGADVVNSWAKTITGVGLFALGAAMMDQGLLTGGPDEDEEKAEFDELVGKQNYAIQLPGGINYTIDWLTPAAMPMFMGAQFWKLFSDDRDLTFADMEQVFTSIADPMIQMSMLQGLNDSLDGIKYSDNNLGQFFINSAVSYLTQGLTNTLLGQIEKSTEETRQTTYVDKDSEIPAWMQRALGKASQKIPGWDFQQTDYINGRGETEQQRTDGIGWIYNLTSPGYLKKADVGEVEQELYRLYDATGENIFPESPSTTLTWTDKTGTVHKDQNLTAEQADTLKKTYGQTYMRLAGDIMKSKDYDAMSEEQVAKMLQQADTYARKKAEIAAIGDDHTGYDESWMMEMDAGAGADYIIRRVTKSEISGAMDDLDTAWDKGYDTTGRSDDLKWAYDTFSKMSDGAKADVREWLTGTAAKYVEAREKGVSHEDFLTVAEGINSVKGTGKYNAETGKNAVREIDRRRVIANANISTTAKDKLMMAYMEDYEHGVEGTETSELKYQYIRQELGLSSQDYIKAYEVDLAGGKWRDIRSGIMKALGCDYGTANKLLLIFEGRYKQQLIDWYTS